MTKENFRVKSLYGGILRRLYRQLTQKAFFYLVCLVALGITVISLSPSIAQSQSQSPLWQIYYERSLKQRKYVGYAQAEAVANLDRVPEVGALVAIGYPKFQGVTGGFARYIAICPPDWKYGVSVRASSRSSFTQSQQTSTVG